MKTWMIGLFVLVVIGGGGYLLYQQSDALDQALQQKDVPEAVTFDSILPTAEPDEMPDTDPEEPVEEPGEPSADPQTPPAELPASFNLAVPFTPQAPHANWDLPYQEACEEASVLMSAAFLGADVDLSSANAADAEILDIVDWQQELLDKYLDTTAEETAFFANERYPELLFEVVQDPTVEQIKAAVAQGSPVIVPAAGTQLGNPFFSGEGPVYHMLVVRGYTETSFITNDPGTRRGEGYAYRTSVLMDAMGDWNDGNPAQGKKAVIIVSKR